MQGTCVFCGSACHHQDLQIQPQLLLCVIMPDRIWANSGSSKTQGFLVGSDGGTLFLFERDGEGPTRTYRKTKTLVIQGQPVKIRNLAVSPTEDTLLCTLENNQMYSLNLTNTELMKASCTRCAVLCCAVLCCAACHAKIFQCIAAEHILCLLTQCTMLNETCYMLSRE